MVNAAIYSKSVSKTSLKKMFLYKKRDPGPDPGCGGGLKAEGQGAAQREVTRRPESGQHCAPRLQLSETLVDIYY